MSTFPYADRYAVHRRLPEKGTPRTELLEELHAMATEEDATWESGRCSGTMYCGDHDHYRFMNEAFGLFAHVNVLQRDMCPSATKFEAEIIAMTLDLLHAEAVADGEPVGLVSTGGTGSICHAMLAYREQAAQHPGRRPAERDQARDRPPRLRQGLPPVRHRAAGRPGRPGTTQVDTDWVDKTIDDEHGRHRRLGLQLRLRHHRPDRRPVGDRPRVTASACTSTAASAGSSSPSARSSATTSRSSTTGCRE